MDLFAYRGSPTELYAEDVPLTRLAADVGTPVYVYSKATLLAHYRRLAAAFAPLHPTICFSIKSCPNLQIVKTLLGEGSGMDVTSGGELFRALRAGCDPQKIFFAGVGKTDREIREAIKAGIRSFNVESEE